MTKKEYADEEFSNLHQIKRVPDIYLKVLPYQQTSKIIVLQGSCPISGNVLDDTPQHNGYKCACHGIEYDKLGRVRSGDPALKNLDIISSRVFNESSVLVIENLKQHKEKKHKYYT